MSTPQYYEKGTWNVVCDECGRCFRSYQLMKRWDGFMVCSEDWEPRQPQDFVRGVADKQAPPWTKPESSDTFINLCTLTGSSATPSYATPGCMTPGVQYAGPPIYP